MAELIEQIVSEQAFKQVEKLKADLVALQTQFEQLIKTTNSDGFVPKSSLSGLSELEKIKKQIVSTNEKVVATETIYGQLLVTEREALKNLNKELRDNERLRDAEEGSIDQLRKKLSDMERAYAKMGEAARNSMGGKDMIGNIQKTYTELTKLEQSMGRYQRNVGNYTNATFQLSQVFRELPSFTFSAQTGMMALSNNLPMLADAFKQVRQETGSTASALAVFGKSIFSLGNIFTLAMSAFIIFQKEITAFITGTKEATKATHGFSKSLEDSAKSASSEIVQLQNLYNVATDYTMSMDKRIGAVNRLQELYPNYLGNLSKEAILAGEAQQAYEGLVDAMIDKAIFQAFETEMQPIAESIVAMTKTRDDLIKQRDSFTGTSQSNIIENNSNRQEKFNKAIDEQNALISTARDEMRLLYESGKEYFNIIDKRKNDTAKDKTGKSKKSSSEKEIDRIKILEDEYEKEKKINETAYLNGELDYLQHQLNLSVIIDKYSKERINSVKNLTQEEADSRISVLHKLAKDNKELWDGIMKYSAGKFSEFSKKTKEENKTSTNANMNESAKNELERLQKYIDSLPPVEVNMELKLSEQEIIERIELIGTYVTATLASLDMISQAMTDSENRKFDLREKRMNDYYDTEEKRINRTMANGVKKDEALMKLAAQKEAQQKKIDAERATAMRKAAARQKVIDILQIVANTALGITAAMKEGDAYTKIARAVAAGVIGTTQLAIVASTPLPEYAKGTENAPEGFAKVSEKGQELVVEPSGKKWLTPAKESITYLKKGSKVIPNDKLMKMVQDNAFVQLSQMNMPITSDMYGKAMIDQFEELTNDIKALKNIMADKDMKVSVLGNFDHYMHVKKVVK